MFWRLKSKVILLIILETIDFIVKSIFIVCVCKINFLLPGKDFRHLSFDLKFQAYEDYTITVERYGRRYSLE